MQCPTKQDTNIIDQPLNPELQNENHHLSDIPVEEAQLLENSLDPLNPNPDYVEQQNVMPPQPTELNLTRNINDIGQFEQEQLYLLDNKIDSADHQEQHQYKSDDEINEKGQPDKQYLPVQPDYQMIKSTLMSDDQYRQIKSIEQKQSKFQTHTQIIKQTQQNNIQASDLNQEGFKSQIPVVHILDLQQQENEIEISKSIIYNPDTNHFYIRYVSKKQKEKRKMISKYIQSERTKINQTES